MNLLNSFTNNTTKQILPFGETNNNFDLDFTEGNQFP
jgi:hypothetical protein